MSSHYSSPSFSSDVYAVQSSTAPCVTPLPTHYSGDSLFNAEEFVPSTTLHRSKSKEKKCGRKTNKSLKKTQGTVEVKKEIKKTRLESPHFKSNEQEKKTTSKSPNRVKPRKTAGK